MAGQGPPPKHPDQRRRTNAKRLTQLPAEGRKGKAPKWPLTVEPSAAEASLWAEMWRLPQAVLWERQRIGREVAMYVIWSVKAEGGALDASKESRMLADRLGLTSLALLRLECEIVADETAEKRAARPAGKQRILTVA